MSRAGGCAGPAVAARRQESLRALLQVWFVATSEPSARCSWAALLHLRLLLLLANAVAVQLLKLQPCCFSCHILLFHFSLGFFSLLLTIRGRCAEVFVTKDGGITCLLAGSAWQNQSRSCMGLALSRKQEG